MKYVGIATVCSLSVRLVEGLPFTTVSRTMDFAFVANSVNGCSNEGQECIMNYGDPSAQMPRCAVHDGSSNNDE